MLFSSQNRLLAHRRSNLCEVQHQSFLTSRHLSSTFSSCRIPYTSNVEYRNSWEGTSLSLNWAIHPALDIILWWLRLSFYAATAITLLSRFNSWASSHWYSDLGGLSAAFTIGRYACIMSDHMTASKRFYSLGFVQSILFSLIWQGRSRWSLGSHD